MKLIDWIVTIARWIVKGRDAGLFDENGNPIPQPRMEKTKRKRGQR